MLALTLTMPPLPHMSAPVIAYRHEIAPRPGNASSRDCLNVRYEAGTALTTALQNIEVWNTPLSDAIEDQPLAHLNDEAWADYQPKTALGKKLLELRRAYLASGGKLLSADALDEEMRDRRGGISYV